MKWLRDFPGIFEMAVIQDPSGLLSIRPAWYGLYFLVLLLYHLEEKVGEMAPIS